jgi:hypothetical protein
MNQRGHRDAFGEEGKWKSKVYKQDKLDDWAKEVQTSIGARNKRDDWPRSNTPTVTFALTVITLTWRVASCAYVGPSHCLQNQMSHRFTLL